MTADWLQNGCPKNLKLFKYEHIAGKFSTTDVFYPVVVKVQDRVAIKRTVKTKPQRCILKCILVSNDSKRFGKWTFGRRLQCSPFNAIERVFWKVYHKSDAFKRQQLKCELVMVQVHHKIVVDCISELL